MFVRAGNRYANLALVEEVEVLNGGQELVLHTTSGRRIELLQEEAAEALEVIEQLELRPAPTEDRKDSTDAVGE